MATQDLKSRVTVTKSLNVQTYTAATDGTSVDMTDHEGVMCVYTVGAVTGTDATVILQDSDDDTTFATVVAAKQVTTMLATISTTTDDATFVAQYFGTRRYVRPRISVVGTNITMGATLIQSYGRHINA